MSGDDRKPAGVSRRDLLRVAGVASAALAFRHPRLPGTGQAGRGGFRGGRGGFRRRDPGFPHAFLSRSDGHQKLKPGAGAGAAPGCDGAVRACWTGTDAGGSFRSSRR